MAKFTNHYVTTDGTEIILDDKYLKGLPFGGPREFFTAAKAYLNQHPNQNWEFVDPKKDTADHLAWKSYFAQKHWRLLFMSYDHKCTFPTKRPEDFDPDHYQEPKETLWDRSFRR
jgi:hypothetical protein